MILSMPISPTEASPSASCPVGYEGGDEKGPAALEIFFTSLDPVREWMRYCEVCMREQRFVADRECGNGLVGQCSRCGDERVVRFSRSVSEV